MPPELRTRCETEKSAAQEARAALIERLSHAKTIDLHEVKRGKYFRLVAEVIADGENMSDLLLARGLARPYEAGHESASSVRKGMDRGALLWLCAQARLSEGMALGKFYALEFKRYYELFHHRPLGCEILASSHGEPVGEKLLDLFQSATKRLLWSQKKFAECAHNNFSFFHL